MFIITYGFLTKQVNFYIYDWLSFYDRSWLLVPDQSYLIFLDRLFFIFPDWFKLFLSMFDFIINDKFQLSFSCLVVNSYFFYLVDTGIFHCKQCPLAFFDFKTNDWRLTYLLLKSTMNNVSILIMACWHVKQLNHFKTKCS